MARAGGDGFARAVRGGHTRPVRLGMRRRDPPRCDARAARTDRRRLSKGTTMNFEAKRDDLRTTRIVDEAIPALDDGQALLRVSRFALTANNVTYAVFGDAMAY